jgi:hypothetical protein
MNLETVSTLFITVAQGITVDYSAHIVHCFLKTEGPNKDERIKQSMVAIGPAVFNGAISTFAGFCFCVFGTSPITFTFFKVFSLIVWSGLFGAFVVLPVILSLFGPSNNETYQVDLVEEFHNGCGTDNPSFVEENEGTDNTASSGDGRRDERAIQKSSAYVSDSLVKAFENINDGESPSNEEKVEASFPSISVHPVSTKRTNIYEEINICPPHFIPCPSPSVFSM